MGTNGLTDATAEKLGLALKANNKLEGLSLWQNGITAEVFALKWHAHTRTRAYTQSPPSLPLSIPQGGQYLAEGLQVNKTLLWLGLGSNHLEVEGAWALFDSLRANQSLIWLGIGGNSLGDRGVLHLVALLQGRA